MSNLDFILDAIQTDVDDCILWPYATDPSGYGSVKYKGKKVNTHRLVCLLVYGEPEGNLDAAHRCGVRACVNRNHLRWATRKENVKDSIDDGTFRHHSPRKVGPDGMSWCWSCGCFLPVGSFTKKRTRWNGLSDTCRDCKSREYRMR